MKKKILIFLGFFLLHLQPFAQQGMLIYPIDLENDHAKSVFKSLKKAASENLCQMQSQGSRVPLISKAGTDFISGATVAPNKYFVYLNWDAESDIFYIIGITPLVDYLGLADGAFKIKAPYFRISDFENWLLKEDLNYIRSMIKNGFYQYINSKTSTSFKTDFDRYFYAIRERDRLYPPDTNTNATVNPILDYSPSIKVECPVSVRTFPVKKQFLSQFPTSWLKSAIINAMVEGKVHCYENPTLTIPITFHESGLSRADYNIPSDSIFLTETWVFHECLYGSDKVYEHDYNTVFGSFKKKYFSLGIQKKDNTVIWTIFDDVVNIPDTFFFDNKLFRIIYLQYFESEFMNQLGITLINP